VSGIDIGLAFAGVAVGIALAVVIFLQAPKA
jgi:hypothetical protein